jgi:hypothetical protein
MSETDTVLVNLLVAASHKWGAGKIHVLNVDSTHTLCGRTHQQCPGEIAYSKPLDEVTCQICAKSWVAARRREEQDERWAREQAEWAAERARKDREWLEWYDAYLASSKWRERRQLVMQRAGGMCEGCGKAPASEVHHLTYERVGDEMLFDLVAICHPCHQRIPSRFRQ